jgi:hypothetical protein
MEGEKKEERKKGKKEGRKEERKEGREQRLNVKAKRSGRNHIC